MSEILGRLNRTIEAQGPDKLWVDSRDALAAAYQTISDLRLALRSDGVTPHRNTDIES